MADRYDLKVMRKGSDGKSYGTRIGAAFPWKEKDGFNLVLDALPIGQINDKGEYEVRLMMAPPFDRDAPFATKHSPASGFEKRDQREDSLNDDPFGLPDV